MKDAHIANLLRWYRKHGRNLPWRKTRDPYKIFVSEMMLQQTQVSRVLDFYRRWMKRFPNWKSLSRAKTDALIRAWAGLGYNRRALYVREAAQSVVRNGIPRTIDGWNQLKGVGPYSAAAIYAFVEHKPAVAIDTNIRRVIGRMYAGKAFPEPSDDTRIAQTLSRALTRPSHYEVLYALMDLGALICTVSTPYCATCPMRTRCKTAPKNLGRTHSRTRIQKAKERMHEGKKYPDRIYRGRILQTVRTKRSVRMDDIGPHIDETFHRNNDRAWVAAMVERLVRDGLIQHYRGTLTLPKT